MKTAVLLIAVILLVGLSSCSKQESKPPTSRQANSGVIGPKMERFSGARMIASEIVDGNIVRITITTKNRSKEERKSLELSSNEDLTRFLHKVCFKTSGETESPADATACFQYAHQPSSGAPKSAKVSISLVDRVFKQK